LSPYSLVLLAFVEGDSFFFNRRRGNRCAFPPEPNSPPSKIRFYPALTNEHAVLCKKTFSCTGGFFPFSRGDALVYLHHQIAFIGAIGGLENFSFLNRNGFFSFPTTSFFPSPLPQRKAAPPYISSVLLRNCPIGRTEQR